MIIPASPTTAGGTLRKGYKKTSPKSTGEEQPGELLPDEDDDFTSPANEDQLPLPKKGGATIGTEPRRRLVQAKQSNRIGGSNDPLAEADLFNGQVQKRSARIHKNRGRM